MNLEQEFESRIDILEKKLMAFPVELKGKYCQWLSQQYYLVENSTRYLALSASRVSPRAKAEFREWAHHLSEELDHDLLVLKDLEKLKYSIDPILPIARGLVAAQYYDISTYGPNALLGYALMLEGLSVRVCAPLATKVEAAHGKGTATYLRLHANVDADHYPEGLEKIRKLDAEQAEIVKINLDTMADLYIHLLDQIQQRPARTVASETISEMNSIHQ